MRKLYDELFHIPKHGKICEKVILMRTGLSVIIMLFCLAAISITAFARFSCNVTSHTTVIKAVVFQADVGISVTEEINAPVVAAAEDDTSTDTAAEGETAAAADKTEENEASSTAKKEYRTSPVDVTALGNGVYTADLAAGKVYTITLSKSAESSASTGFCIITANGCQDTYHTQQLGADANAAGGYRTDLSFELQVTSDTTLTILSHWGTSSYYAAESNRLYITSANTGGDMVVMNTGSMPASTGDKSADTEKVTEKITQETEVSAAVTEKATQEITESPKETEKVTEKVTETEETTEEVTTVVEESTTETTEVSEPETTELVTQEEETEAVEEDTTEVQTTEPVTELPIDEVTAS